VAGELRDEFTVGRKLLLTAAKRFAGSLARAAVAFALRVERFDHRRCVVHRTTASISARQRSRRVLRFLALSLDFTGSFLPRDTLIYSPHRLPADEAA